MREIKFRGKRLDNGEWIYGDLLENQGRNFIYHATSENTIEDNDDGRIVVVAVEVDYHTVGQYTGLKDKNGQKIYESDIIECIASDNKPIRHIVRYVEDKGGYHQFMITGGGVDCDPWDAGIITQQYIGKWKYVIGNVFDNPELLKGCEQ